MKTFEFLVGFFDKYVHTCETTLSLDGGIAGKECLIGSSSSSKWKHKVRLKYFNIEIIKNLNLTIVDHSN